MATFSYCYCYFDYVSSWYDGIMPICWNICDSNLHFQDTRWSQRRWRYYPSEIIIVRSCVSRCKTEVLNSSWGLQIKSKYWLFSCADCRVEIALSLVAELEARRIVKRVKLESKAYTDTAWLMTSNFRQPIGSSRIFILNGTNRLT